MDKLPKENEKDIGDVSNNNKMFINSSQHIYDVYNEFIFSNDIKIMGKLLHRFMFFEKIKHLPGDIVELGVFKGSGMAAFMKFIEIFCTYSNKRVIGFDLFDVENGIIENYKNGFQMTPIYDRVDSDSLSYENVSKLLSNTEIKNKHILVKGDVCKTSKEFVDQNPGFRASLIYVDLNLCEPVYHSLKNLYSRLLLVVMLFLMNRMVLMHF